ncbi:hypothetical protein BAMA_23015 [Bacillus manliponensis]|uniref:Uncharacterized protein n=1 Tax=Bacillus manliponensis TaxID=574376 RepID=A0A073JW42_9BACI|nr:hypothetical protein [Bacillus manliponensis]KEK19254.1 hypothetical protein BAMA_23015 [Bacillus manliponensis]
MKNDKVRIPKFFYELFGGEQFKSELTIIITFTIFSATVVGLLTIDYWSTLKWYQQLVLFLLYIDIAGGVIANLTYGTDIHYHKSPVARWTFIAIHVQPLLVAWIVGSSMPIAFSVWSYTIVSAIVVNLIRTMPFQRTFAGALLTSGLIGLFFIGHELEQVIFIIYMMYMMKVIYSFAVYHHKGDLK